MFDEQIALARLAWAFILCTNFGHPQSVLIMWRDHMVRACPRCGKPD
jgi:hypothetical protein